jgi:hypothetical protein
MKKKTLKAHKNAARLSLLQVIINTHTKVLMNKKKIVKPFVLKDHQS